MREATARTGLAAAVVIALAATTAASPAPPKWRLFEVPSQGRANLVSVTAAGGNAARNVPLPDLGDHFSLDAIDARGPRDVWVAGTDLTDGDVHREHLLLLHWNGRFWKRVPEPATGEWTNRLTRVRIAAGGDVWVSGWGKRAPGGDEIRRPLLLLWNGREWTAVKVPDGRGELMDVAVSGKQTLAVGDTFTPSEPDYTMYALRRTETGWQRASVPVQGMASLSGLAPIPGGGLWGVARPVTASTCVP
jgi:hypothetical protein